MNTSRRTILKGLLGLLGFGVLPKTTSAAPIFTEKTTLPGISGNDPLPMTTMRALKWRTSRPKELLRFKAAEMLGTPRPILRAEEWEDLDKAILASYKGIQ